MTDFSKLKDIIEKNNSFILSTHVNPDADALGSEIAFYNILKKLNKEVRIINHSYTPYNLEFLDTENVVEKFDLVKHEKLLNEFDVLVALDLNQSNRLVSVEKAFTSSKQKKICIDHHTYPEDFVDEFFGDVEYSATGEILYDFIEKTKIVEIDYSIAMPLYAAIMTDTGSFRFDRTTPRIHRIVARLLGKGVDPSFVYSSIFEKGNFSRIKLLGRALNSMTLDSSEKISFMILKREDLKETGAVDADVEGFVNFCLTINNVQIGLLFYELKDGLKISFRSKGDIPVNELAAEFGGGGHLNAAGTRLVNVDLNECIEKVVFAAQKYIEK